MPFQIKPTKFPLFSPVLQVFLLMDTLFRLVSNLQPSDQSYNSSTSSKNSVDLQNHCFLNPPPPEQCFTSSFMVDQPHFSASSSSNHRPDKDHVHQDHEYINVNLEFSNGWASTLIVQTAIAIVDNNASQIQQLMWMLNELGSPYGDIDQKLAFYFLRAMFSHVTNSGERCYQTLAMVSEKRSCFASMRRMVLKFQEVSPWMTFGHVASNGVIMEAFEGEKKLHIIDISNSFCTQWPTFLEALASRSDETPHLRLTTLVVARSDKKMMREISRRMEKFARLMGVPFKFKAIYYSGDISQLNFTELGVNDDEALAINCVGAFRSVTPVDNRRDFLISLFGALRPRIITVVEEQADLDSDGVDFVKDVQECLRWFRVYFDSLDGSFPSTSDEKLMLERAAGRAIVDLLARAPAECVERRETAARWARRLHEGGFKPVSFSEDVNDDVRALLRKYKDGWTVLDDGEGADAGIFLAWKGQAVVWAAAWTPEPLDGEKSRQSSCSH
ncbi:protein SHORT-ROOT-like isoform X2 [Cucurbita maxima]|uniref:Protein SHORT-ROOT-like isoform X2 n=1 Tax=Cucurbita maxima TaxID=3661 RepID=A0A6J1KZB8_CUCMA|nr:protein SHORT-ROOT-like isoform X2 [Cucurbita maxima]